MRVLEFVSIYYPGHWNLFRQGWLKARPKKGALSQTSEEYASRTTIHGIGYIFDKELSFVDRLLWLLSVLAFLGVAAALTWNFWSQWRNEQVMF